MIYLDANATTACSPTAMSAVAEAMAAGPSNPSSIHLAGINARSALEKARDDVCLLLPGTLPEGIVFNSGGTEGNNAVIRGWPDAAVVTSNVEHPSVSAPASASKLYVEVSVGADGMVDPDALSASLPNRGPVLVSIQWANSETGIVQPIPLLIQAIRKARPDAFFHVDAAQAVGRVPISVEGIDAITCSGHKLHAPAGTGVTAFLDPDENRLLPLLNGGGQERGRRSGTQNVPGAAGLGAAFKERSERLDDAVNLLTDLRNTFERLVRASLNDTQINGADSPRVPNTSNMWFPGVEAMALVAHLDQGGVACSVGAACSSGRPEPSKVLLAMGLGEIRAYQSVRFSFSVLNTLEEVEEASEIVARTVKRLS
ncbi:cysteine desulfurase family protein [Xanthobacter agilis]|uniref:cysteine desulfurase family protein n=1 Tax=Xanthobacter agilis TaxID=47492 RepID=UPI0037265F0F